MVEAVWNGQFIAESEDTVVVEGNHYFPRSYVRDDVLRDSSRPSRCPWRGMASYFTLKGDGATNRDAACYHSKPSEAAQEIAGHVAF